MKHSIAKQLLLPAALLAGIANAGEPDASARANTTYHVINLPTTGGSYRPATASTIWAGWLARRICRVSMTVHANLWRNGSRTDLGTLGGPNSNVVWPVKNIRGRITGIAQTGESDPLNERWSCRSFFPGPDRSGYRCLGFVWENGTMTALPRLQVTAGVATESQHVMVAVDHHVGR